MLAATWLFLPMPCDAADVPLNAKTLARLREFVAAEKLFEDSPAQDRHAWLASYRLSRQTRDDELPDVEAFALRPEAKPVRWLLAGILIQRNRFDAAAHVLAHDLAEDPKDHEYRMWKWWEYNFKVRPDFDAINLKIAEGFVRQFGRGSPAERLAIAEVFGKGRREADLSAAEFRRAIGLPEGK
jgi:hypothetical protein